MKRLKPNVGHNLYFPNVILNDEALTAVDRLLIAIIIRYDNEDGCFMNNSTLASLVNCSTATISKSIKKMQALKYIILNKENPNNGGRSYVRKVNQDLKKTSADKKVSHSSPKGIPTPPPKYKKHTLYIKDSYNGIEEISIKEEKKIIQDNLKLPLKSSYDIFKKAYTKTNPILWTSEHVRDFCKLSNLIYSTMEKEYSKCKEFDKLIVDIFNIVFTTPPKFFNDRLPRTYLKFWNQVIQDKKLKEEIRRTKMNYSFNDEDNQSFI